MIYNHSKICAKDFMYAFIRQLKIGVDYVLQKFLLPSWLVSFFLLIYLYFGSAGSSLLLRFFSSCSEHGLLFIEVFGLLI